MTRRSAAWLAEVAGLAVVAAMLVPATAALAYWRPGGAGSGRASAAVLEAPRTVTSTIVSAGSDDVVVTWDAARPPSGAVDGYRVQRRLEAGAPAPPVPACGTDVHPLERGELLCTDLAVPDGTWRYEVVALYGSWTSTGTATEPVTVRLDTAEPTIVVSMPATAGVILRSDRVYVRTAVAGSFRLTATITDAAAGPASATFPLVERPGWTHALETVTSGSGSPPTVAYQSSPFTWVAGAASLKSFTVVGTDRNDNAHSVALTSQTDNHPPAGGDLRVNGAGSTAVPTAPTTTWSASGSFALSRTDYVEKQTITSAGLQSSVLTRQTAPLAAGTCGTYGAATVLTGAPAQDGLTTGCYRFTLTGTDVLGNVAFRAAVVKVDRTAPAGAALSVNGTAATAAGSRSSTTGTTVTVATVDGSDPESGLASAAVVRTEAAVVDGGCGATFGTTTRIVGSLDAVSRRTCYRYVLTAANAAGGTTTVATTVTVGPLVPAPATATGGTAGQPGDTLPAPAAAEPDPGGGATGGEVTTRR